MQVEIPIVKLFPIAAVPESPVPVEQWMKDLPAEEISMGNRLCSCRWQNEQQRRRWARIALFKPMALEEMRRRYNNYEAEMLPEEKELYQKTVGSFELENGAFTAIRLNYTIKAFYTPWSPLLWFLLVMVCHCNIFMPTKFTMMLLHFVLFKMKDNPYACNYWYLAIMSSVIILPLSLMVDLSTFIVVVPLLAIILSIIELFLLTTGLICYDGIRKYREFGFFHSAVTVNLVVGDCDTTEPRRIIAADRYYGSLDPDAQLVVHSAVITHLHLKRIFHGGPLQKIFADMDARNFGFGSIDGQQVTAEDVKRFNDLVRI